MKKMFFSRWNTIICSLVIGIFPASVFAQDFHLSHYDAASQYLNPALTGMYFGERADWKAVVDYRAQWRTLPSKPFTTAYASFDMPYKKQWGIGGYIISNKAGTENVNTLNVILSGAYKITTGKAYVPYDLTVGLQMGLLQRNTQPNTYLYDNQYSPTAASGFDPSLPDGESFTRLNLLRFDANMGIYYKQHNAKKKVNPYAGFSISHITKPNQSFTSLKNRMPMHFVLNGGATIKINDEFKAEPMVLLMMQAKAFEFNVGSMGYYHIQKTEYSPMMGFSYRYKDAVVIHTGLKQGYNVYRISYDINTSSLKTYSRGRGAIEFSVIYMSHKKGTLSSIF